MDFIFKEILIALLTHKGLFIFRLKKLKLNINQIFRYRTQCIKDEFMELNI